MYAPLAVPQVNEQPQEGDLQPQDAIDQQVDSDMDDKVVS
jgi:hypothetical protein